MVRLGALVRALGGTCPGLAGEGPDVRDVHLDSRRVGRGALFAALASAANQADAAARHGRVHARAACERGAVALLSDVPLSAEETLAGAGDAVPNWIHPAARRAFGEAAALVHGRPSERLFVVAVTGTNGKTTTAHLCAQLLRAAGREPAVVGTVGYRLAGGIEYEATHTTPDAGELQRLCAEHAAHDGDAIVLEASSHALEQERLAGLELDVAVFTNLSPEHLDHHGDMAAYRGAKARLFDALGPNACAVLHADDPAAEVMAAHARARGARVITYSVSARDAHDRLDSAWSRVDLTATSLRTDSGTTWFFLSGMGVSTRRVQLPLLGRFNVENALAATAVALLSGASLSRVLEGFAAVSPAPGRLEPVPTGERGFTLLVDYAHTEDALARVLDTARELVVEPGARLLCVFGCGGDRDRSKRGPMGLAVATRADIAIVTSDNPRGEDPAAIGDEVLAGMAAGSAALRVELDRARAIELAIELARPGDVVLLAGKGHERFQEIGGERRPFDDRRVALEALAR